MKGWIPQATVATAGEIRTFPEQLDPGAQTLSTAPSLSVCPSLCLCLHPCASCHAGFILQQPFFLL